MDPVTASLAATAAVSGASALSQFGQAKGQQRQAKANAYIGETRAIQADTQARAGLSSELGSLRESMGSSAQSPSVGTFEIMNALRTSRDRERRIEVGGLQQEARNYSSQARAYGSAATGALLVGAAKAGSGIFDLYAAKAGPK